MRIAALKNYRRRHPAGYFQDLSPTLRASAYRWLDRFCTRRLTRGLPVEPWLFAIYCGQARRLALNPPNSAWGKSMLAKRGGYAVQRRYVLEGRTGPRHPAHKAARVSAQKRKRRKAEGERERLGSPSPPNRGFTNLDGI
jgi:hypothetical protein